jgi:hypothetical protein
MPLQAGYRSKNQSSTHKWLHVTSLAISFPQCYVTCMFQFFKFYLSALPSPPLVSLSEHQPVCFFSGFPFLATVALVEQWPQSPSHAVQVMGHAGCWCCCWLPHPWCHQRPEPVYRVVAVVDAVGPETWKVHGGLYLSHVPSRGRVG